MIIGIKDPGKPFKPGEGVESAATPGIYVHLRLNAETAIHQTLPDEFGDETGKLSN